MSPVADEIEEKILEASLENLLRGNDRVLEERVLSASRNRRPERPAPQEPRIWRSLAMAASFVFCAGVIAVLFIRPDEAQDPSSKRIAELVERLRSDAVAQREEAARQLLEIGAPAIPELEKAARSDDPALATLGGDLLREVNILKSLTPNLRKAIPGIRDRLAFGGAHAWTETFLQATAADGKGARKHPALTREDVEILAMRALLSAEPGAERAQVLCRVKDWKVRVPALEIIQYLSSEGDHEKTASQILIELRSREIVPEIVRLVHEEPRRYYNSYSLDVLRNVDAPAAIRLLVPLLREGSSNVRARTAWILGELRAREAIPSLLDLVEDKNAETRRCVAFALGAAGAKEAIPELIRLLRDRDHNIRSVTLQALMKLEAKEAVPEIIRLVESSKTPDPDAMRALGMFRARNGIPVLLSVLNGESHPVYRWIAAQALVDLEAREAIPGLIALLDLEDEQAQAVALRALARLEAREAVPEILKRMDLFLDDKWGQVSTPAVESLIRLKALDGSAGLVSLLSDRRSVVRAAAAAALCRMGSRRGVQVLLDDSKDWTALIALKEPRAWAKLQEPYHDPMVGKTDEILRMLARKAGLRLVSPHMNRLQGYCNFPAPTPGRTLFEALHYVSVQIFKMKFVVEGDELRILTPDEAREYWTAWWSREKSGKR